MKLFSEETLAHYGIPGQKKGTRRWQYPDGRFNEEGKIRYFKSKDISDIFTIKRLQNANNEDLKDFKPGLFDFEYKKIEKNIEERKKSEIFVEEIGLYKKNTINDSIDTDMKNVNPHVNYALNKIRSGFTQYYKFLMNCPNCASSYILRRIGYDATANASDSGFSLHGNLKQFTETLFGKKCIKDFYQSKLKIDDLNTVDVSSEKHSSLKNFDSSIKKMKNGDAGLLTYRNVYFKSGHILNYEKQNNQVYIIDGQINKKYKYEDWKKKYNDKKNTSYGKVINSYATLDLNKIKPTKKTSIIAYSNLNISEDTLAHYGILGQKWGERRWQNQDGTFNEAGKERYFGITKEKILNFINKGKEKISMVFQNDKKINLKIGKQIDKDFQQLMLNKNKYTQEEFNKRLFDLSTQKNFYNQNLKPKKSWSENFIERFSQTTSNLAAVKLGKSTIDFILGE